MQWRMKRICFKATLRIMILVDFGSASQCCHFFRYRILMLPDSKKNGEEYTSIEYLSIAVMIAIGTFA